MNTFAPALSRWSDIYNHTVRSLASEAGIAHGEISRIRSGTKGITLDSLIKLLPAVERLSNRSEARSLLVAYLNDETPPAYAPDVQIRAIADSQGNEDKDLITLARDRWEGRARKDAEFAKMWLTMDGYMHAPDAVVVDKEVSQIQIEDEEDLSPATLEALAKAGIRPPDPFDPRRLVGFVKIRGRHYNAKLFELVRENPNIPAHVVGGEEALSDLLFAVKMGVPGPNREFGSADDRPESSEAGAEGQVKKSLQKISDALNKAKEDGSEKTGKSA